ncbi:MAG: hypothetical protein ACWGN1_06785 [Desulfobulbales bacterium]
MKRTKVTLFKLAMVAVLLLAFGLDSGMAATSQPLEQATPGEKYAQCLDCHDYEKNHHPVDIPPFGEIPFPLTDGKITCRTCHYDDHETGGRNFLREGPYLEQRDICFKCHHQERYAGLNPHLMLDEKGGIKKTVGGKSVCIICHLNNPNPEMDRTEDVQFRADVGFLCWRCHPPMANALFLANHFLVEPSPAMLRNQEKNEKRMTVLLPLVPRGRVTCSTCHNPHQQGVIIREAAAKGADSPARLRIPSPRLCFVCHPI